MDNSLLLKLIITMTMMTGLICIILPMLSASLRMLVVSALFYLFSTIVLGVFYVQNGSVSCVFLDLGSFSIAFHLELFGVIFLLLLASLWCVTIVYSWHYFATSAPIASFSQKENKLALMTICVVVASLVAMSANMITMFIFYEILTLCTLPLVFQGSLDDLGKYFRPLLYPALLLWLPAILYINYALGSTNFLSTPPMDIPRMGGIILFLACIFGISKAALVPFHTWLPRAMVAPYPVSAMLHSVAVVNAGLFCVFKIMFYIFGLGYLNEIIGEFNWLLILPAITILYASFRAFKAKELKQVLAFSTVSQLSICLLGAFLLSKAGIGAAVIHMLSHSATKITLFFAAGAIYTLTGKQLVSEMKGLYYKMPYTCVLFSIGSLSLCGAPLLAGYYSKAYLHAAASEEVLALGVMTASTIATCLYILRVVYLFFIKPKSYSRIGENMGLVIPTAICAVGIIAFPIVTYVTEKLLGFL